MKDGPLRAQIKRTLALHYVRGQEIRRLAMARHGQLHWELAGGCEACAACCEAPTIMVGTFAFYAPFVARIWLWWQRVVNGFVVVDRLPEERAFVFRCTHFDTETRRCDSYESRPGICHDYPRMQLEVAEPSLFDGCKFRVRARNGASMLADLRARGISGAQLVQISKKLKLE